MKLCGICAISISKPKGFSNFQARANARQWHTVQYQKVLYTNMSGKHNLPTPNCIDWSLQPFRQDCNLVSHTTNVVCVNFTHEGLLINVEFDQPIWETFHGDFYFTVRAFARRMLRESRWKKYLSILRFVKDVRDIWVGFSVQG